MLENWLKLLGCSIQAIVHVLARSHPVAGIQIGAISKMFLCVSVDYVLEMHLVTCMISVRFSPALLLCAMVTISFETVH